MIAARVNMTKRTVYARYADKAALFAPRYSAPSSGRSCRQDVLDGFDQGDLTETLASGRPAAHRPGDDAERPAPAAHHQHRELPVPRIFTANFEQSALPVIDFVASVLDRAIDAGQIAPTDSGLRRLRLHEHGDQRPGARDRERPPADASGMDRTINFTVRLLLDGLRPR